MPAVEQSSISNILLASLPPPEFELLQPHLEWVDLKLDDVLSKAHEVLEYGYFPVSGYCSIVSHNSEARIETGLIGREGFVGVAMILLVDRSPHTNMVQSEGRAVRISRAKFSEALKQCPTLNRQLLHYIHVFILQSAYTSLANAHYKIEERLARWLLMGHDRTDSTEIFMTHQFLSLMLAVRRSGITDALHVLEGKRLIKSTRGRVTILNRSGLEEAAKGSYGIPEREYERLIAPLRNHVTAQT